MAFAKKDSKFKWDPAILREVIEKSGLSYQQVSNATEISIASLNAYMNRNTEPGLRPLLKLSDYFCIPVDVLLGHVDEKLTRRILNNYDRNFMKIRRYDYEATFLTKYDFSAKSAVRQVSGEAPWPYNLLDCLVSSGHEMKAKTSFWTEQINADQEDGLNYAIDLLDERMAKLVRSYYEYNMTLEQCGEEFGLTRERVRQIIQKAILTLRHPSMLNYVLYGLHGNKRSQEYERKQKALERQEKILDQMEEDIIRRKTLLDSIPSYSDSRQEKFTDQKIPSVEGMPIESLQLSARAYNGLSRIGCSTIGDVCNVVKSGKLTSVRNLGKKSQREILDSIWAETGEDFRKMYRVNT